jgi:hypothetical protein
MAEFTFITSCPACGAKNRVRLNTGRRVRIRCGKCGEPISVDRRRVVLTALWQRLAGFFNRTLPLALLKVVEILGTNFGSVLAPLAKIRNLIPYRMRKRLAWMALAVLVLYYFLAEGTIKFSSLLFLAVLLVLATLVVVVAARGPAALREISRNVSGKILHRCPNCGHRYFRMVKNCPNCGH